MALLYGDVSQSHFIFTTALQNNVGSTDALNPPDTWDDVVDPSVVQLQKLRRKDIEYEKLLDAFMTTLKQPGYSKKVNVLEISRIQNLAMWQSYVVKRQTIGMSGDDERYLVESLLIRP